MTLNDLKRQIESGSVDTVVVAFTDMQGRLMGKRVHGEYFLEQDVGERGVEGCNYLLALDMEMDPVPGYQIANWERGYGDFLVQPDLNTLRLTPWLRRSVVSGSARQSARIRVRTSSSPNTCMLTRP